MRKMDGKLVAQSIKDRLKKQIKGYCSRHKTSFPKLAVLLAGDHPASQVYVKQKIRACEEVGIQSNCILLPKKVSGNDFTLQLKSLNHSPGIHGILIQLPLPSHLDTPKLLSLLNPLRDPDCLSLQNQSLFWSGMPRVLPCTPAGVLHLLDHYKIPLKGKKAVVVGRSRIVGLPLGYLLLQANATVTVCHSHTQNLSDLTRMADIVVSAAGCPGILGRKDFKKGAVVVDVGIHRTKGKGKDRLLGDVKTQGLEGWPGYISPVPGGVGPMTVAALLENTFHLFKLSQKKGR